MKTDTQVACSAGCFYKPHTRLPDQGKHELSMHSKAVVTKWRCLHCVGMPSMHNEKLQLSRRSPAGSAGC